MIRFKQFLRETPQMVDMEKYHIKSSETRPVKNGARVNGYHYTKMGSSDTHDFYTVKISPHHNPQDYDGIHVSDKKGNLHYEINGMGKHNSKKHFSVGSTASFEKRTIPYHEVISHLLTKNHLNSWESDYSHTKGSRETYRKLTNHPDLDVHHVDEITGKHEKMTPDNFDDSYKEPGTFLVTRKK